MGAGVLLGLARALGETIAVTIVIGNAAVIGDGLFTQGYSLAAVIAELLCAVEAPVGVAPFHQREPRHLASVVYEHERAHGGRRQFLPAVPHLSLDGIIPLRDRAQL